MPFPITEYDRPDLAIANLLKGDLRGAGASLFNPDALSPEKQKSIIERMRGKLKSAGKDHPLLQGLLNTVTSPLVIISLLISSRYPVMGAKKLMKVSKTFVDKAPGFFAKWFGRAEDLYAGSNFPDLFLKVGAGNMKYDMRWYKPLIKSIEKYADDVGQNPSHSTWTRVMAATEKLDEPGWAHASKWTGTTVRRGRAMPALVDKIVLNPAERALQQSIQKNVLFPMRTEVIDKLASDPAYKKLYQDALARMGLDAKNVPFKDFKRYWPRVLLQSPEEQAELARLMVERGANLSQEQMVSAAAHGLPGHLTPRLDILMPDTKKLAEAGLKVRGSAVRDVGRAVEDYAHSMSVQSEDTVKTLWTKFHGKGEIPTSGEHAFQIFQKWAHGKGLALTKKTLGSQEAMAMWEGGHRNEFFNAMKVAVTESAKTTRMYDTNGLESISRYLHSFRAPYVWHFEKVGKGMKGLSEKMNLGQAFEAEMPRVSRTHATMMRNDYMPILKGQLTSTQTRRMMEWTERKLGILEWMKDPKSLASKIPKGTRDKISGWLTKDKGPLGYLGMNSKIASHFYFSTLGFNPSSAFQNLLQPLITTMPLTGPGNYFNGVREVMSRFTRKGGYLEQVIQGKVPHEQAIEKVFPEFFKSGLGPEPMSKLLIQEARDMVHTAGMAVPSHLKPGSKAWLEGLKKASMAMFTQSERFNRLTSFHAGLGKAVKDGLGPEGAGKFAAWVVRQTQFPSGPGQMPRMLLNLPAPMRQFMYFPIRYLGFLANSTRLGGGIKRNWGTLARSTAYSAATAKLLGGAGVDVSHSLMMGALPLPAYQKSPFFPFPVVPPLLSVAGGVAQAAFTGETEPLGQAASLLVPFGVPARRAIRTLHPKYARYKERGPDGRIPVYGKNKSLVGRFTPTQLFMRSVGLKPSDVVGEQQLTRYLLKHRDEIREMRRDYVEAMVEGNAEEAQRVNAAFQSMYPELGPIQLKKSDVTAAKDRRELTRIQRLIRTLPRQHRAPFEEMIRTVFADRIGSVMVPDEAIPPASQLPTLLGSGGNPWGAGGSGRASPSAYGLPRRDPVRAFGPGLSGPLGTGF